MRVTYLIVVLSSESIASHWMLSLIAKVQVKSNKNEVPFDHDNSEITSNRKLWQSSRRDSTSVTLITFCPS